MPLCAAEGVDDSLRRLVGLNTLDEATLDAVKNLLLGLRGRRSEVSSASGGARQAFVGLHRIAYERLSELSSGGADISEITDETGVLCELGEELKYCRPGEAFHDDGRFGAYMRHFAGRVPFVALAKDRAVVAERLGVAPFRLTLERVGEETGRDVTEEARAMHGDRITELLAIMAHYSLGTQTLDETSEEFGRRASRIQNLQIKQLKDLVVDASVEGSEVRETIGKGSDRDLFLENPTSSSPILFHDFSDDEWQTLLRRKISTHLAMVLENPAYDHTFARFLQFEADDERDEFLHELGISSKQVADIEARIGVEREENRESRARWFHAILAERGHEPLGENLDDENLISELKASGLSDDAHRLVELGGGEEARRETGEGSALRILADAGVNLKTLHEKLKQRGDDGLSIRVSRRRFSRWMDENRRRLSAVLAMGMSSDEEAKARARSLSPPLGFEFSLDPKLSDLLTPVVGALRDVGFDGADPDPDALASDPASEFVRLGDFRNVEELNEKVSRLFDEEERGRFLRERAAEWRKEIRLLAVLVKTGPHESAAHIRSSAEWVDAILPDNPSTPLDLRDAVESLFAPDLAVRINGSLSATVNAAAPEWQELMEWARDEAVSARLDAVKNALDKPKLAHVREIQKRSRQLGSVRPTAPNLVKRYVENEDLGTVEDDDRGGAESDGGGGIPRNVPEIKVGESHNRRKRELGDEGERWALSAVIGDLVGLDDETREAAIGEIEALLHRFSGSPVEKALSHAELARKPGLDEEELIEELSGLLHLSQYSDAFGFDMIGWLAPTPDTGKKAVCLEVKSTSDEGFRLTRGEWILAERLHGEGTGSRYAALVVRRAKGGGAPVGMDLLPDPVALVEAGLLRKDPDGYQIAYESTKP